MDGGRCAWRWRRRRSPGTGEPAGVSGDPHWYATLVSPALISFFLFRVTGIPATERQAVETKGDEYRDYQRTTSSFVPWFPKTR
jgi:steroid 5-alpha reductase family enzyme